MAASYISALVIKHNNTLFYTEDGVLGKILPIPTPGAGGHIAGDYWAIPITDYGVISGIMVNEPSTSDDATPPTIDSIKVFRLVNENGKGRDTWIVRGRSTSTTIGDYGYIQASQDAECCTSPARSLPTSVPLISPCELLCNLSAAGLYFMNKGLPTLSGNLRYLAYGTFNNVALASLTATGYTSGALLATGMNSAWSATIGGTFAFTNNVLQFTQTAGPGTDVLCVTVTTVNPSA